MRIGAVGGNPKLIGVGEGRLKNLWGGCERTSKPLDCLFNLLENLVIGEGLMLNAWNEYVTEFQYWERDDVMINKT